MAAGTIGRGRGGPGEVTAPFLHSQCQGGRRGGHKRWSAGAGGRDFRESQFLFYQRLHFLFSMEGTLNQSGTVAKYSICRVHVAINV